MKEVYFRWVGSAKKHQKYQKTKAQTTCFHLKFTIIFAPQTHFRFYSTLSTIYASFDLVKIFLYSKKSLQYAWRWHCSNYFFSEHNQYQFSKKQNQKKKRRMAQHGKNRKLKEFGCLKEKYVNHRNIVNSNSKITFVTGKLSYCWWED